MSGKKRPATNDIKIIKNGTTLFGKDLAQSLNAYFLSVSNDLPPLNPLLLPAFLPAPKPVPKIFPNEVCTKMLNSKVLKSSGPDNIPNRIIKDSRTNWPNLYVTSSIHLCPLVNSLTYGKMR